MLTIRLPPDVQRTMTEACRRAGRRETGGMLFGEHVGPDDFRVVEATVAGVGSFASFVRALVGTVSRLETFFRRTKRDYRRFNYLGEWHSHPSFALRPSAPDDDAMFDIVNDGSTGALFAVAVIVKVDATLDAAAFVYFPPRAREDAQVVFEQDVASGELKPEQR